jgi:hypothetical protein
LRVGDVQYSVVGQPDKAVVQPYTATQKSLAVTGGLNLLYFFAQIGVRVWLWGGIGRAVPSPRCAIAAVAAVTEHVVSTKH